MAKSKRGTAFARWVKKANPTLDQSGVHDAFNAGWDACLQEQERKRTARTSAALRDARYF